MKESLLFIFICISLFNSFSICLLEENNTLNINIDSFYGKSTIGKKGLLAFYTDFEDAQDQFDPLDIEEKTKFKATISKDASENKNINCELFKLQLDKELIVLCNVEETIPNGAYLINFNSIKFKYKELDISLESVNANLTFNKENLNMIDLFSDEQKISVEENKDSIELKFKVGSYNNEILFLVSQGSVYKLDNCKAQNNELKCQIPKNKLDEFLQFNGEEFSLYYIGEDNNFNKVKLVGEIYINYTNVQKKDVFVGITKLIEDSAYLHTTIAYETNITDISEVSTPITSFKMNFVGGEAYCGFKKIKNNPLLMVCSIIDVISSLGTIEKEIDLDNINIKYNFKIQPATNNENITVDSSYIGSNIMSFYPDVLDFSSKDSLKIVYIINSPERLTGLRFNFDSEDLKCEDFFYIKTCTVPKSHFNGKESGFFYISHKNNLNNQSISYEAAPVKVILTGSNNEEKNNNNKNKSNTLAIVLCIIGCIILLALIILIIICVKKKRIASSEIETEKDLGELGTNYN